ncbi:hypothetical protein GCM10023067_06000 [Aminobacter aganoensis]
MIFSGFAEVVVECQRLGAGLGALRVDELEQVLLVGAVLRHRVSPVGSRLLLDPQNVPFRPKTGLGRNCVDDAALE